MRRAGAARQRAAAAAAALPHTVGLRSKPEARKLSAQFVLTAGSRDRPTEAARLRSCAEYGHVECPPARLMRTRRSVAEHRNKRRFRSSIF